MSKLKISSSKKLLKHFILLTLLSLHCYLFIRMLRKDKEEVEAIKHAKALEAEKAMYSVRYNLLKCVYVCAHVLVFVCVAACY